jgi:RimJ/RimL family protein N-acetyltransferase
MTHPIKLRPATIEDRQFVDRLLYTTMHQFVEDTWPNDLEAQRHYYEINQFDPANTRIIQVGDRDAGRISTTIRPDCIFIDEIHIAPEYQHQGVGRQAIEQVRREASDKHLPVKATVLTVNHPSQRFLARMGFEVVGERDHRFHVLLVPSHTLAESTAPSSHL